MFDCACKKTLLALFAEGNFHLAALSAAVHRQCNTVTRLFAAQVFGEIFRAGDCGAIHAGDDIAHADACGIGWTAFGDAGDKDAAGLINADLMGQVFIQAVAGDADPGFLCGGVGVAAVLDAVDEIEPYPSDRCHRGSGPLF